jgi:hypothetical protein
MAISAPDSDYCKYCGSIDTVGASLTDHHGKTSGINPSVKIGELGIGASIGRENNRSISYLTRFCKKCYNVNVNDLVSTYRPIIITTSSLPVVIPYTLSIALKTNGYDDQEILQLVTDNSSKMDRIQKKWLPKGQIPCKWGRVGYKIKLELKNKVKIICWVIIDTIESSLAYRLAYGGAKIRCP